MILFFNKKLLIKCNTFEEKKSICSILINNNIEFQSVNKGIGIVRRLGRIFWFNIYVNKKDYMKAKKLIKSNDSMN